MAVRAARNATRWPSFLADRLSVGRRRLQKRRWSEGFRSAMADDQIDCCVGSVPYWEGHPLVALLFGWPGSTAADLQPYMQLYDRMSVPCIAVPTSIRESLDQRIADRRSTNLFAELQVELCNLRSNLLLHFFSASYLQYIGPFVYFARRVTKGIVFDSGPTLRVDREFWRNSQRTRHAVEAMAASGVCEPLGALSSAYLSTVGAIREFRHRYELKVKEMASLEMMYAPQLYMHCRDDPMVSQKEFRELLEYNRERKNLPVWEVSWPGARHLGHLAAEPDDYESVLRDFVQTVSPLAVEQLEVGRNAGAEWPPSVPTDEEMTMAYKWGRPYLSPYHEDEVAREQVMQQKRLRARQQLAAVPESQAAFQYPDGEVRAEPPLLDDTSKWIAANKPELPPGVQDLSGRAEKLRPTQTTETSAKVMPLSWKGVYRDYDQP
eukprot:TRINITY_DN14300_c0_g1_i1.p1 TRINITY_DN14300_c0_g1~~TRINITY_DN14300_c0_g1_i1.p1  ORF type:complete len:450 (+),score=124.89 TRINITY_DN14300_c0_g1_i1:45-1352(+)